MAFVRNPFSFKDPFDTKDMRSTAAADARYDIDFPARDHTLVAQLRRTGAIIYGKAVNTEYNGIPADPGGRHEPEKIIVSDLGYQRSSWSGNPHSAYDSTRAASLGSSSGSGASVSSNLVMCSVCEETSMSCRGPANHNSVALLLPHKSMISFLGGAIGADIHNDRAGIHCRSITDSAKVLDALKDPENGYYDPRDVFTTVPRASIIDGSFAAAASSSGAAGSLKGVRIGVIRESMLTFPGVKADEPIAQAAAKEIRDVLGTHLGATLVESTDPLWPDDAGIENMKTSYTRALAELVPVFFPDLLYRLNNQGQPVFPEFAAAIKPTEFAPGKRFGSGTLSPVDYMLGMAQEGSRVHRDARRLGSAQRAIQVLERRTARDVEELGGGRRSVGTARRAPGRSRAPDAARTAATRRDEGDPGEQARRRGAAAHVTSTRQDRVGAVAGAGWRYTRRPAHGALCR